MHKIGSKTDCQLGATAQLLGSPIVYPLFRQYICRSQGNKDHRGTKNQQMMPPPLKITECGQSLSICCALPFWTSVLNILT